MASSFSIFLVFFSEKVVAEVRKIIEGGFQSYGVYCSLFKWTFVALFRLIHVINQSKHLHTLVFWRHGRLYSLITPKLLLPVLRGNFLAMYLSLASFLSITTEAHIQTWLLSASQTDIFFFFWAKSYVTLTPLLFVLMVVVHMGFRDSTHNFDFFQHCFSDISNTHSLGMSNA